MSAQKLFKKALALFARDEHAVAAVEFALILPVLLFTYIGTAEVSTLITMDRKVAVVAGTVGDLVARADGTLQNSILQDYFEAAEFTMRPYPSGSLKQVVTGVYVDEDGKATVRWSEGFNGGVEHARNSVIVIPAQMAALSKESHLIVGEASNVWQPALDYIFTSGVVLQKTYYYRPRFDAEITIN